MKAVGLRNWLRFSLLVASGFAAPFLFSSLETLSNCAAQEAEVEDALRWIENLEQRRLFRLAAVALDQAALDQTDAEQMQRAQVHRVKVEAAWAVETIGAERTAHWQEAHALAQRWLTEAENHRQEALLTVQDALTWLAEAETLRDEDAGAAARDPMVLEQAMEALRSAKQLLEKVDESIPEWMNERDIRDESAWDAPRWLVLQRNVKFHLARVALERGYWFTEEQRVDRMEAFQSASLQMQEVARQVDLDEPLAWQVILAWARSARAIGDMEKAFNVLIPPDTRTGDETWLAWIDQAPPNLRGRLIAERIRFEQDAGALDAAGRWATKAFAGEFGASADLDLAILEQLLARFEATEDEAFQNQAVAWAKQIEQKHGPYWGRRAQRILVNEASSGPIANLDLVMQIADERMLQGKMDEALSGYREALALSKDSNRPDVERLATVRLGALAQATGQHADAITWFDQAASLTNVETEQSRMTWLAIYNRLMLVESLAADDTSSPQQQQDLLAAAIGFLERWPGSEEAPEVRVVAASRLAIEEDWINCFAVAITQPLDLDATDRTAIIIDLAITRYAAKLSAWRSSNPDQYNAELKLLDELLARWFAEDAIPSPPSDAIGATRRVQRLVQGLRLANLASDPPALSEPWLEQLEQWAPLATSENSAGSIALVAEARLAQWMQELEQGEATSLSSEQLSQFATIPPAAVLTAVRNLASQRREQGNDAIRATMAGVELQLLEQALSDQRLADVSQRVERDMLRVAALLEGNRKSDGIKLLEQLTASRPDDGQLQTWAAEKLVEGGAEYRQQALEQWRRVTARSAPRTDRWFEGRYWIARLTFESGDKERAKQLLEFLKETPPGWDEAPNREALEELYSSVSR